MYQLVHEAGMFFDQDTWVGFERASMEFLNTYQWLSQECSKADKKQYNIVPKFHYFYHLVQQSRDINPRFVWCYGGEDLVGRPSSLAHSCIRGTPGPQVPSRMMAKYRIAKHIEWSRH